VVIPAYNVESDVAECLDSVLDQSYTALDVVVVDDGSTDGTAAVVAQYVRRDERVRLVRQANAGPGAARNTGVRHSRGPLLGFADSDDMVPAGAYQTLVTTLLDSGSDFVVGTPAKQFADGFRVPDWLVPLHLQRRVAVHIADVPDLVRDIFAWNKVFRRAYWDAQSLCFPEGVAYEDHAWATRAYLGATAFDVLPDVVYNWRQRDDGRLSITHRKHQLDNLLDALTAKREVCTLIDAYDAPPLTQLWHSRVANDLRPYFDEIPGADGEYWRALQRGVREVMASLPEDAVDRMPVRLRLLCWLTAEDRRSDVETLVRRLSNASSAPAVRRGGRHDVLELPELPDLSPRLRRLAPVDRRVRVRLASATADEHALRISGVAQLVGVSERPGETGTVEVRLLDRHGAEKVPLSTLRTAVSDAPARPPGTPAPLSFEAALEDPRARLGGSPRWVAEVVVRYAEACTSSHFTAGQEPAEGTANSGDLRPRWTPGWGLEITSPI